MMTTVTFLHRMKRSWRVQLNPPTVPYANDRDPHVETHENGLEGKTFTLGQRNVVHLRAGFVAVTYDVVGLTNQKKSGVVPAHFTIFYGPAKHAHEY